MNKALRTGISVAALGAAGWLSPAKAADIYVNAPGGYNGSPAGFASSWAGFYLGGHLGYESGNVGYNVVDPLNGLDGRNSNFEANGIIGGGQIGYNLRNGDLVYGIEVDLGGIGLQGSKLDTTPGLQSRSYSSTGGFYGDLTGRLGYASDRTLFYAKGGAAFVNAGFASPGPGTLTPTSDTSTLWGWTLGAGVEQRLSPNWSVKLEYQHFDFGNDTFDNVPSVQQNTRKLTFSPAADAVTLGVNYFISPSYSTLK